MKSRLLVLLLLTACARTSPLAEMQDPVFCDTLLAPIVVDTAVPQAAVTPGVREARSQAEPAEFRLTLNVPAYRVELWRGDSLVSAIPVAVGARKYPTPRGTYAITTITWNPWWIPPPSEWARKEKPTPPGPRNPMGKVKLSYSTYYYLHGTPDSGSIGRAASHGCVRLRNSDAVNLALLLQREGLVDLSTDEQQELLNDWDRTRTVPLTTPLPIDVRYEIIEVRDSALLIHEDIYRLVRADRTEMALRTLSNAGVDQGAIDSVAVKEFVKHAAAGEPAPLRTLLKADSTSQ